MAWIMREDIEHLWNGLKSAFAKPRLAFDWLVGGVRWLLDALIPEISRDVRGIVVRCIFAALAIGFFVVLVPTLRNANTGNWSIAFGTAGGWALACLASGLFAGFLFGIPKVHQELPSKDANKPNDANYRQQVNNNLQEISDWLTKIIVGVGLIELRNVPSRVDELAAALYRDLATLGTGFSHAYAGGLIVYFIVIGFLTGYLLTRLFLAKEFRLADQDASGELEAQFRRAAEASRQAEEKSKETVEKNEELLDELATNQAILRGKTALQALDDPQAVERAIPDLVRVRQKHPDHRGASIVLARLHRRMKDWGSAISVLKSALEAKTARGTGSDVDAADIRFNLACYYCVMADETSNEADKTRLREQMYDELNAAIRGNPTNAASARDDEDFHSVRDEIRFKAMTEPAVPSPQVVQQPPTT